MKLNLEITSDTTPLQLRALAKLFHDLAGDAPADNAVAFSGPPLKVTVSTTSTSTPEVTVSTTSTSTSETDQAKPTRRRRTKAEIEADEAAALASQNSAVADAEALAQKNNEADTATAALAAQNSAVADAEALAQKNNEAAVAAMTETTSQKADGGAEPGEAKEKIDHGTGEVTTITGAEGKPYTEGEVQALATLIARSKGPDVVRNKITELGGTRISALTADQINALGAFLESQK